MEYGKLSAIELQREIDRAEHYAEDSGPELCNALKEIARLRTVCQDIVEIINTDSRLMIEPTDPWTVLHEIDDIAHRYFITGQ